MKIQWIAVGQAPGPPARLTLGARERSKRVFQPWNHFSGHYGDLLVPPQLFTALEDFYIKRMMDARRNGAWNHFSGLDAKRLRPAR